MNAPASGDQPSDTGRGDGERDRNDFAVPDRFRPGGGPIGTPGGASSNRQRRLRVVFVSDHFEEAADGLQFFDERGDPIIVIPSRFIYHYIVELA